MTTAHAHGFRVRFEDLPYKYAAISWQIPNHTHPFEPLPAAITCLYIPRARSLLINRVGDRRPRQVSIGEAATWGYNEDDIEVIYAQAKTADASQRFCLRMIFNAEHSIQGSIHSGPFKVYERLLRDAIFHSTHLLDVEGLFVPLHYGMWAMNTGDWAGTVLFSLTQWCGIPWNELQHTKMNTKENRILIGRTFETLHDHGIDHGRLRHDFDLRHVLIDVLAPDLSRADLYGGRAKCYIVDFSEACANHQCARKLPILPQDAMMSDSEVGCAQTADVMYHLEFMQPFNLKKSKDSAAALAWHAEYSRLYPDLTNCDVLIAQRAKLYNKMPPVYPGIRVSFESEDRYCQATITPVSTDSDEEESGGRELDDGLGGFRADSAIPDTAGGRLEKFGAKLQPSKLGDRALCS